MRRDRNILAHGSANLVAVRCKVVPFAFSFRALLQGPAGLIHVVSRGCGTRLAQPFPWGNSIKQRIHNLLAKEIVMGEFNLVINEQERKELLRLLRSSLGETRVEVHRTHTPGFRESVKQEEQVIRNLLEKVERFGD